MAHRAPPQRSRLPRQEHARNLRRDGRKGLRAVAPGLGGKTHATLCYDSERRPRGYLVQCERKYSWGSAKEDFILPEAHTVIIRLGAEHVQAAGTGKCEWTWQPRAPGGKSETRTLACGEKLTLPRVPYSADNSRSGVAVTVKLPDGRTLADPNVSVEDLLIAALGDSFASGESNPDRPVTFSANRRMTYDPNVMREDQVASRSVKPKDAPAYGLASGDSAVDPKTLPRRLLDDEEKGLQYKMGSREFAEAFERRNARWVSPDCHRSQYGYPFRVAMQMALENRHRAVTLVHLACTGAEVANGLFLEKDAREQFDKPNSKMVPAQFDQLSDLICRGGTAARTKTASYALPIYSHGKTSISTQNVAMRWCPPGQRKRGIDVVLLSIGGNDVGFSALAYYTISDDASAVAPIAALIGSSIRFGADVTRVYLGVLDVRLKAVKDALNDGFGVAPSQVVQTSYEPLQFDETGAMCGMRPTLGVDVHPKLRISRERIQEASTFQGELLAKLECMSDTGKRRDCPSNLATGRGTGFKLVTEHLPKFAKRGVCARDPQRAQIDGAMMAMPRKEGRATSSPQSRQRVALWPPLAPVPHAERRLPHGQYAQGRDLAVRHHAAGLCRALQRRPASDRRGARRGGRQRAAACALDRGDNPLGAGGGGGTRLSARARPDASKR